MFTEVTFLALLEVWEAHPPGPSRNGYITPSEIRILARDSLFSFRPVVMSVGFLGTTIGSLLVASWFATALSGVLLFQAYHYFRGRPAHDHAVYGGLVSPLTQC